MFSFVYRYYHVNRLETFFLFIFTLVTKIFCVLSPYDEMS
jgi:hypothetical protein